MSIFTTKHCPLLSFQKNQNKPSGVRPLPSKMSYNHSHLFL